MSSIHNDLASWSGKARILCENTITITTDFADQTASLIVKQAVEIDRLKAELFEAGQICAYWQAEAQR
jgi:hypothetical protein